MPRRFRQPDSQINGKPWMPVFRLETAGAIERLILGEIAVDLFIVEPPEMHGGPIDMRIGRLPVRTEDGHRCVEHDGTTAALTQLFHALCPGAGLCQKSLAESRDLVAADNERFWALLQAMVGLESSESCGQRCWCLVGVWRFVDVGAHAFKIRQNSGQ
jgi:hypothetical protein